MDDVEAYLFALGLVACRVVGHDVDQVRLGVAAGALDGHLAALPGLGDRLAVGADLDPGHHDLFHADGAIGVGDGPRLVDRLHVAVDLEVLHREHPLEAVGLDDAVVQQLVVQVELDLVDAHVVAHVGRQVGPLVDLELVDATGPGVADGGRRRLVVDGDIDGGPPEVLAVLDDGQLQGIDAILETTHVPELEHVVVDLVVVVAADLAPGGGVEP